ncbi:hypothetical protein [Allokutzneria albata]|uniref:Uncharacterized protein n=1 Tax=Allokutzneria albata TaxID=211114 RepID=A0A1H0CMA5_ALLAB|nr:hypothetical protein [Allokutzneria albata]SDN59030.1 hypothetical protein SAMN04489726_7310 [Allokutzneria albata]
MSWEDFYRRRDALDAAVTAACARSDARLPAVAEDPLAGSSMGTEDLISTEGIAAALHYRWMLLLTSRVDLALLEAERTRGDRVEAVTSAWHRTAETEPALRRVLDANPVPEASLAREHRMLALAAGLAEDGDSEDDVDRIGATFLGLVRSAPKPATRRSPLSGLLRKLALTA